MAEVKPIKINSSGALEEIGATDTIPASAVPVGGATTQVQYNNAGVVDGAANVKITSQEDLNLAEYTTTAPNTPSAGTTTVFSQEIVPTKNRFAWISEDGVIEHGQNSFIQVGTVWFQPFGNNQTVSAILWQHNTTGTIASVNVSASTYYSSQRRIGFQTSSTSGSTAGTRHALAQFYRGDAAGRGGFLATFKFGISTNVTGSAVFVGFAAATAAFAANDPSTLTNIIAIGKDAADTNFQIIYNDASGTASKVDLGANFPATSASTDWYRISFYAPSNGATVSYFVKNETTGNSASGTLNTDLPASTQLLASHVWTSNRAATGIVQIDLGRIIIENTNQ